MEQEKIEINHSSQQKEGEKVEVVAQVENLEEREQKTEKVEQVEQKVETKTEPIESNQQAPTEQNEQPEQENVVEDDNESSWTDATESVAADDDDEIWAIDDDIMDAMEYDSEDEDIEEGESDEENEEGEGEGEESKEGEKPKQKKKKSNEIDFTQLEEQFVKGNESNENWRLGKHQKFCTFVAVSPEGKEIITGGGDDQMLCFRQSEGEWKEFYALKHTETVNKIQVSYDGKYIVSLTENQAFCTEISTLESKKFEIEEPSDFVCHKQGGVVVIAHEYTISIYNLKGLSLFTSYTLDIPPTIISFCDKGKQIVAACENKLRIITPKNGQIIKGSGEFHKEEISALVTGNNMAWTGCIEGKVFASNLNKGAVVGQLEPFKGTINLLSLSDNNQYLLVAPQGEGVHWIDTGKMKRLFHNPKDISATDIVQVHSPTLHAISDLGGKIHLIDRRSPLQIIKTFDAGNSIHKLASKGSLLFAACEDGFMRVFDVSK